MLLKEPDITSLERQETLRVPHDALKRQRLMGDRLHNTVHCNSPNLEHGGRLDTTPLMVAVYFFGSIIHQDSL